MSFELHLAEGPLIDRCFERVPLHRLRKNSTRREAGVLQTAEKLARGGKKRQGTTSVVPYVQQNNTRALAPEA